MCTKMLILISPLPNVCIPCVEVKQKETNIALLIPFRLLNKAIFGLGGLEFCQKMRICMLNLVVLITHFCLNLKYLQYKCVSCNPYGGQNNSFAQTNTVGCGSNLLTMGFNPFGLEVHILGVQTDLKHAHHY